MMLQALIEYAERENLGDPDFEPKDVDWLIPLNLKGQVVGPPLDLREHPKRKYIPSLEQKLLTDARRPRARFLCDSLERACGLADPKKPERAARVAGSLNFFKELLRECRRACPAETAYLNAILQFLEDADALKKLHLHLAEVKAKPNELATFSVDGIWVLDLAGPKQFWRSWRRKCKSASSGTKRICLATGELAEAVHTTDVIKGVPGGNASGTIFLSFDKDAFCSFGLRQAQNAALSAEAELKIRSALNALIEKSRAQKLVFQNTICLHWTRQPVEFDPVDTLASADPQQVARLLKSVQTGQQALGLDANAYYAVSLSGNGSRIVVRDWIESTVPEVERHVARWFEELEIVDPGGMNVKREYGLGQLLWALANPKLEKPFDALPHGAAEELLRAALTGGPVPQDILRAALRRETVDRVSGGDEAGRNKPFVPSRFALIKLCLLRSPNRKDHYTMNEKLDPNSKDVAYLCGQLFAVLGRLQLLALGKIGASIAERTYGGVATRPATTLGPLFTKVPAYLKKANDRFPGAGTNKQKEIEALCQRIEAQGGFPQTLGLEEQGRFALGYYCQLAEFRARAEERELLEKAEQLTEETV
ncbi:MAG: type I-C CRISPR-associated protein Cas8c/Csd1 [Verrucomicrobia bacterium]|nr:type I-C CRISPR-associated protein Cas8c/Csd1 [Verrucomicrobiota bacterium]